MIVRSHTDVFLGMLLWVAQLSRNWTRWSLLTSKVLWFWDRHQMGLKWREQLVVVVMLFGKCNKNSWKDKSLRGVYGLCIFLLPFLPVLSLHGCCPKNKVLYFSWLKMFCKVYYACVSQEVYLHICVLSHSLCIFQNIILWEFQNWVYWERKK